MGLERVRPMLAVVAPVQAISLVAVVVWALSIASPAEMMAAAAALRPRGCSHPFPAGTGFVLAVTSTCAGCVTVPSHFLRVRSLPTYCSWSTLTLNIADVSRFAKSRRSFVLGQVFGFLPGNVLCPVLGWFSPRLCHTACEVP